MTTIEQMIVMAIGENVAARGTEDMGENALSFLQHKRKARVTTPSMAEVISESQFHILETYNTKLGAPANSCIDIPVHSH